MPTTLFTYEATSAEDMISTCQRLALVSGSGPWSFRGHADARWRLIPSLLREHDKGHPRFSKDFGPRDFEGLLRDNLGATLKRRAVFPEHLLADWTFLLAFAQHYGIPTRLSDWTRDPLTALYFASSGALRRKPDAGAGKLAVFAMADIYLDVGAAGRRFKLVSPPAAGNKNLTAQRGHHVLHPWKRPDMLDDVTERPTPHPVENVSALMDSRFIRLDTSWTHAGSILRLLHQMGLTADLVYPSEYGVTRYAEDLTLLRTRAGGPWPMSIPAQYIDLDKDDEEAE